MVEAGWVRARFFVGFQELGNLLAKECDRCKGAG
jgi:hypothetical protein